jgi:hypothetical protein
MPLKTVGTDTGLHGLSGNVDSDRGSFGFEQAKKSERPAIKLPARRFSSTVNDDAQTAASIAKNFFGKNCVYRLVSNFIGVTQKSSNTDYSAAATELERTRNDGLKQSFKACHNTN